MGFSSEVMNWSVSLLIINLLGGTRLGRDFSSYLNLIKQHLLLQFHYLNL